ncbi:unnamed protein product [Allacma fusca]|uniref:Uncharacterized protein n=1 Tax=Allacma fusca TaxID=39272 RepID=A0A8J2J8N9_9HEXA|nr:unnamed protein product [Allacma fusca]
MNPNHGNSSKEAKSCLTNTSSEFSGHFYGGKGVVPETFHCKASECYKTLISEIERVSNHGKNVVWRVFGFYHDYFKSRKLGSPLQRMKPHNLHGAIYRFLTGDEDSNFTAYNEFSIPEINLDLKTTYARYFKIFPVSNTDSKIFITSDSVEAVTLEYKIYTTPFDTVAWICITGGIFLVALILSSDIILPGRTQFLEKFTLSLLSVIGSLVDKEMNKIPKENQFESFCEEDLDELIEKKLTLSQTALVVFSKEFDYYWNRVRLKMQGTNLKFSHNRNAGNDPFLRIPTQVIIAECCQEKYHHVARRAHVMLSSGLFWMWEKWDRIRFPECNSGFRAQTSRKTDVRALSMESSLVMALYAFLRSLLVCLGVFIAEAFYCYCFSRQFN